MTVMHTGGTQIVGRRMSAQGWCWFVILLLVFWRKTAIRIILAAVQCIDFSTHTCTYRLHVLWRKGS
eukprot:COSAG01_NODE_17418_length_1152_cov_60.556505_2_plen_66_part_01